LRLQRRRRKSSQSCDIRAVLPDLKERFEKSGGEVWDMPGEKLDGFIASEHANWTKLIREAGIKLD
jgi:tripartite-type tricarboxylate transporter receptor subunit TctC